MSAIRFFEMVPAGHMCLVTCEGCERVAFMLTAPDRGKLATLAFRVGQAMTRAVLTQSGDTVDLILCPACAENEVRAMGEP